MSNQLRQVQTVPFPLVGGFSQDIRSQVSTELTYNMYVSVPTDQKMQPALLPVPGLRLMSTFKRGAVGRKSFTFRTAKYMYQVIGEFVYKLDSLLNSVIIGEIGTTTGNVGVNANNSNEIIFVDGTGGWLYNESTAVWTDISNVENFPTGCISVGFLDGYFIAFYADSTQFGLSDINSGTVWPLENIGAIQRKADIGVGVGVVKGQVLLFGNVSTETWFDAGGALFPFSRDNNALYEFGCAAVGSIAEGFDKLFWLVNDANGVGGVMFSQGGQPVKVSTYEIDIKISNISDISDAVGEVYKTNGHVFYQLSFTEGNITFLFDYTVFEKTGDLSLAWSLLGDSDFDDDIETNGNRHLMQSHVYFNNTHYVVAYDNNNLYKMDSSYYYYGDDAIMRMRITHTFFDPANRLLRVNEFQPLVIQGVGLANGVDAEPYIELQTSFDGAINWTKPRRGYIGKIGITTGRTIFYNVGIYQRFTYKLKLWNAVDFVFMGGSTKFEIVSP